MWSWSNADASAAYFGDSFSAGLTRISQQRQAYRVLNAGYHSLSIMTYDHVLDRAKRMLDM
jgi:hypothetical protein